MGEIVSVAINREELERWVVNESGLLRGPQPPPLQRVMQQAIDEGLRLAKPRYIFKVYPVRSVRHDHLITDRGTIGDSWFTSMMRNANYLFLAVCTVGLELENQARAYLSTTDAALGYLLDGIGTGLVEIARCSAIAHAETYAHEIGLEFSIPLSPGDTKWPLGEQKKIFALLEPEKIDVTLSPGYVMSPIKSLSLAIGMGVNLGKAAEGSPCDYCDLKERCQLRVVRQAQGK
jgi:hypothetical protein